MNTGACTNLMPLRAVRDTRSLVPAGDVVV